jgi:hypothetical protein
MISDNIIWWACAQITQLCVKCLAPFFDAFYIEVNWVRGAKFILAKSAAQFHNYGYDFVKLWFNHVLVAQLTDFSST